MCTYYLSFVEISKKGTRKAYQSTCNPPSKTSPIQHLPNSSNFLPKRASDVANSRPLYILLICFCILQTTSNILDLTVGKLNLIHSPLMLCFVVGSHFITITSTLQFDKQCRDKLNFMICTLIASKKKKCPS